MLSGEVARVTNLPHDVTRIIGTYASEPDIRFTTVPQGKKKRQKLSTSFKKIINEAAGGDIDDLLKGDYKTEKGVPVTKMSQLSDYVLKQIFDDFSDQELKLLIDPDIPDSSPYMIELRAMRETLTGKKTVMKRRMEKQRSDELERKIQADKEKEVKDTKEAVRISQMAEGYVYDEEEEEKVDEREPKLKAKDLFKPVGYYEGVDPDPKPFWFKPTGQSLSPVPEENQQYDYALLNKAIYNPNPQSVLDKSKRGEKFDILEEDINYMVVKNLDNDQVTLVLKGTDITDVKGQRRDDLIQDIGILLNNEDMVTRTKEMDIIAKRLINEYGDIDVTGHSLSGYMANIISRDNNIDASVFNMGSSPFKKSTREKNDNLTHYTTNFGTNVDPISITASRLDKFKTIQVEPNQDIGSGILKYHTIDHFLEKEKKDVGINKMESLKNILSKADAEPAMEQRDPLADATVRRVNHNFSFMENPLVPERINSNQNWNAAEGIIEDNRQMRNDPNNNIEPNQPILVQDQILEGDEDRMPESEAENMIGRVSNRNIAPNNMSSMAQNYFMRQANDVRRRQMRLLGDPQDEEAVVIDDEERGEEGVPDIMDNVAFEGGRNNRELLQAQLEKLDSAKQGKWFGSNYLGNSEDWRRIVKAKNKSDDLITSQAVNYLRDKEIPWKRPSRTHAGNYVGLIRNSNMAMTKAVGEMLP